MQFVCCPYNPYFALINLSHFENIQQKNIFFHNFLIRFFLLPKINNWPFRRIKLKSYWEDLEIIVYARFK